MKRAWLIVAALILSMAPVRAGVTETRHNLSVSSTSKSPSGAVCSSCHTPHSGSGSGPLWALDSSPVVYKTYTSSTMAVLPGQPDGSSRLCLSCHDGTVATTASRKAGLFTVTGRISLKGGTGDLGTDLSDDHPVSFVPQFTDDLVRPPAADPIHMDPDGKMQCTTCHDPHNDGAGKFLLRTDRNGELCLTCHQFSGYTVSSHSTAPASWNGAGKDPWPGSSYSTVSENSCRNCHRPHAAGQGERLLTQPLEDDVCLVCHTGNVAGKDIGSELSKASAHRVTGTTGVHDPAENALSMPRHVECQDCHNPHAVRPGSAAAPSVPGALTGVSGADVAGNPIPVASEEYQVCIKCHGNVTFDINPSTQFQVDTSNIRLAINPGNPSYHPIAAVGRAGSVPSLKLPYTVSSRIGCTDCHNNDASVSAGGQGPEGPHGSAYAFLLERRYDTADYTRYSTSAYALCFKCHDPNILMSSQSTFRKLHNKHVKGEDTPCSACHDPHGVPQGQPEDGDHIGLINFDLNIVQPNRDGVLKYEVVNNRGYCYLNCHGENHNPEKFDRR